MASDIDHMQHAQAPLLDPGSISPGITKDDERAFFSIVSTALTPEQERMVTHVHHGHPRQRHVLAIHWHPEYIPMPLVKKRIEALFPNKEEELIIPTQHNDFDTYDGEFAGVEIDCFSRGFNQKVQLLLHLSMERLQKADVLKSMASYTFKYRSTQLHEFIESIARPIEGRIDQAALMVGADVETVEFTRTAVKKVKTLIDANAGTIRPEMLKNKILKSFLDEMRPLYGSQFINRAQAFLQAVKNVVKAQFPTQYFYMTCEVIEEARSCGAGVVIPHPEQFWPILLADYDVDGIEVWNPQSRKYTDFIISVIAEKNERLGHHKRRLLIFMGDDTHLSEKVQRPEAQDPGKVSREVGLQPAWDDPAVDKKLITARMDRLQVMREYRQRIS